MDHSSQPRIPIQAPNSLSDWKDFSVTPRPRNEQEEAAAIDRMERVLGDMLMNGEFLMSPERGVLRGILDENRLKELAYREPTEADRRDGLELAERRAKNESQKFLSRLGMECIYAAQNPTLVDWSEMVQYLSDRWSLIKKELFADDVQTRNEARAVARLVTEFIRLPNSGTGRIRLAPDSLLKDVTVCLEWSLELRDEPGKRID